MPLVVDNGVPELRPGPLPTVADVHPELLVAFEPHLSIWATFHGPLGRPEVFPAIPANPTIGSSSDARVVPRSGNLPFRHGGELSAIFHE